MKNIFWIVSGVLIVALIIVYFIFVSGGRDKVYKAKKKKDKAIKLLESLKDQVHNPDFPTTASMINIDQSLANINKSLETLDKDLIDSQSKYHFVQFDPKWKHTDANALQYKKWYDKRMVNIVNTLNESNFATDEDSSGAENKDFGAMGFKKWSSKTSKEEDLFNAHKKLIVIEETVGALSKVFKDIKNVNPKFKKISVSSVDKKAGSRMATTRVYLSIEAPYSYFNKILTELESNKLFRFEIENQKILKLKDAKDFALFPNVAMEITYKFSVFVNKMRKN
ncbi:MAG: hypothetical protein COA79_16805 [Planctomycetota bacterium]|nr:MAG: hypothetical protein COA79_16805 [Planctomycetota bacterium]